jgi:hypothetical protein
MRFIALLKNELRESMPWMLLATIGLLTVSILVIRMDAASGASRWYYSTSPGSVVPSYYLAHYCALATPGSWLLVIAIGLGLVLAGRHFAMPFITRTWPFLLHRSASRMTILAAKLAAAAIAFFVCLGGAWVILYHYASVADLSMTPPPLQVFVEGCLFILVGVVFYCGTALSILTVSRWYTTKGFGAMLATVVFFVAILGSSRPRALVVIIDGAAILLSQIVHTFRNREF